MHRFRFTLGRPRAALALILAVIVSPSPSLAQADLIAKGKKPVDPAADAAWTRLADQAKPSGQPGGATDWAAVAAAAGDFKTTFPDHPQSRAAAKVGLIAAIRLQDAQADLSADTAQAVEAYLTDAANPTRDRLELKITFAQAGLQRRVFTARTDRLQAHEDHAADLIRDFPDQPEGYGYRLSLAKAESPARARSLAQSLLEGSAPAAIKAGAQRVLDRLALEGTALQLAGAEAAVAAARGRPLFLYAWTTPDAGILEAVRRLAATDGFAFLGINLDPAPTAAAQALAASLPGPQFYDGGGLDGPLARQLQLTMLVALYLIDADGIIRDVDAHRDPAAAVARLAGGNGR